MHNQLHLNRRSALKTSVSSLLLAFASTQSIAQFLGEEDDRLDSFVSGGTSTQPIFYPNSLDGYDMTDRYGSVTRYYNTLAAHETLPDSGKLVLQKYPIAGPAARNISKYGNLPYDEWGNIGQYIDRQKLGYQPGCESYLSAMSLSIPQTFVSAFIRTHTKNSRTAFERVMMKPALRQSGAFVGSFTSVNMPFRPNMGWQLNYYYGDYARELFSNDAFERGDYLWRVSVPINFTEVRNNCEYYPYDVGLFMMPFPRDSQLPFLGSGDQGEVYTARICSFSEKPSNPWYGDSRPTFADIGRVRTPVQRDSRRAVQLIDPTTYIDTPYRVVRALTGYRWRVRPDFFSSSPYDPPTESAFKNGASPDGPIEVAARTFRLFAVYIMRATGRTSPRAGQVPSTDPLLPLPLPSALCAS